MLIDGFEGGRWANAPSMSIHMDVSVRRDDAALSDLSSEWMTLWAADPTATVFHTPQYARAAWETELGADRAFAQITMRRDDELAGLVNVTIDPDETLRFLGNAAVTDYLGPISRAADRDAVAGTFVRAVSELDWARAELLGLATDSGWPEAIARAAKSAGFSVTEERHDVCPRIDISGGFDAYLASLNGKLRHEIRRKERRLEREAGEYTIRLSDTGTLEADLRRFYEMHRSSSGPHCSRVSRTRSTSRDGCGSRGSTSPVSRSPARSHSRRAARGASTTRRTTTGKASSRPAWS
jgi:hypothetical protein